MRIRFDHGHRGFDAAGNYDRDTVHEVTIAFDEFEAMFVRYGKEKRRRKVADRATSATYRMVLTDHGREVVANDIDGAERHADAINGTWFTV
tara:strand:+ start:251 stop:526 length:276 start_codon:yes stop_codon:yes gene_type:complete